MQQTLHVVQVRRGGQHLCARGNRLAPKPAVRPARRDQDTGVAPDAPDLRRVPVGQHEQLLSFAHDAEVYTSDDATEQLVHAFAAAWAKVMDLDGFDLRD